MLPSASDNFLSSRGAFRIPSLKAASQNRNHGSKRRSILKLMVLGSSAAVVLYGTKLLTLTPDSGRHTLQLTFDQLGQILERLKAPKLKNSLSCYNADQNSGNKSTENAKNVDDASKGWELPSGLKDKLSLSFFGPNFENGNSPALGGSFRGTDVEQNFKIQLRQQKEIERLERENKELRKVLTELNTADSTNNGSKALKKRYLKKNLVEMYSEILDEMADFDANFEVQDHLPRVVVVGDQSSGKTSVLEMIVQARIFPRGSGQMMTKCPVMVTLSEGPYHVAQFKDSTREFDLKDPAQLKSLQKEIELRMQAAVEDSSQTVSSDLISLTVKGPGLPRMVLVDLPGVINIETEGMAQNTKHDIQKLSKKFMSNRNSIILCVQDGSVDAERSLVTDLVASVDPSGSRTVFVLTKVDLAELREGDVSRVKNILEGKRFPMKARGYFAVVSGTGRKADKDIASIKSYEDEFFSKSQLLKSGIKPSQLTTHNLTIAVSDCFWQMVRASIEQEADTFKAKLFNLESQWKNKFARHRELDRDALFEKGKFDILDEILELGNIDAKHWDDKLHKKLSADFGKDILENIYFPILKSPDEDFSTLVDIQLHKWAERALPIKSIEIAREVLLDELFSLWGQKPKNDLFDPLRDLVRKELKAGVTWDSRAPESLRYMQSTSLEDKSVPSNAAWKSATSFMESVLLAEKMDFDAYLKDYFGPGFFERWRQWKSLSPTQKKRQLIASEVDVILKADPEHGFALGADELTTIRKNISHKNKTFMVDNAFIRDVWNAKYKTHSMEKSMARFSNLNLN